MTDSARIYVDLDDVVCQTAELLLSLLDAEFGRRVSLEEIVSFDLGVSFGLGQEELGRFMDRAHDPEVLLQYELRPGAVEGLETWRARGCEVWIVTGRPTGAVVGTRQWLERAGVPHDELLFVDKYRGHGRPSGASGEVRATRVEELAGMGFGLAVEDSAEMALRLRDEVGVRVLLMDRPWNREVVDTPGRLERCRDWDEVMARVQHPGSG